MADRGLGLDGDEMAVVVDRVDRVRGVPHLPDNDRGDLNRVAVRVVDFSLLRLLVPDPGRHNDAGRERVDPLQPGVADCAAVPAEELDNTGLSGYHAGEPAERQARREEKEHGDYCQPDRQAALVHGGDDDQGNASEYGDAAADQNPQARQEPGWMLSNRLAGEFAAVRSEDLRCHLTHLHLTWLIPRF